MVSSFWGGARKTRVARPGRVVKSVDTAGLNPAALEHEGSTPSAPTAACA